MTVADVVTTSTSPNAAAFDGRFKVAYVLQNVGVDLAAEIGQMILIGHTIRGLEKAGHDVDLLDLHGRSVVGYPDLSNLEQTWSAPLGLSGKRPFHVFEGAIRRTQGLLKLPYFAFFDSFRFYEACLRTLPQYDICHEYAGLLSVGAAYACRRLNLPYVLTVDADLLLEAEVMGTPITGVRAKAARWAASTTYRLADHIICVAEPTRQRLIEQWRVPPSKVSVIPNGVNVDFFTRPVDETAVRMEWGVGRAPVILFVGGFQMWHGLDKLLESVAVIRQSLPDVRLVLVGDGPARAFIERKIGELGLTDQVIVTGLVPHAWVPKLLAIADVVTVPYPRLPQEMWFSPLKLYEYMAAGKAIVASGAGQIANVIRDGQNGVLVTPGDVSELAQAILRLLQDEPERRRLGAQAQAEALAHHTWDRQIERLEAIYTTLTARRRTGGR